MSLDFHLHGTTKILAAAKHCDDIHWVKLTFEDADFGGAVFFEDGDLADAYAAAINSVSTAQPAPAESEVA